MALPKSLSAALKKKFPKLNSKNHKVTSEEDEDYNCVSWAIGPAFRGRWIEPLGSKGTYWPLNVPRGTSVQNFVQLYEVLGGFSICKSSKLEKGVEKIALYGGSSGNFLHVARQLKNGKWTSKLGDFEDISHATLAVLQSKMYGSAQVFMSRPISSSSAY